MNPQSPNLASSHVMSSQERAEAAELWAASPSQTPKSEKVKEVKISQAKKNQMMFAAALSGDIVGLREALELGADPNAQERSYPYSTALDSILLAGADTACFLELMRAGSLSNLRSGRSDGARVAAKEAAIKPEKLVAARHDIATQLVSYATPELMMKASEQWAQAGAEAPTPQQWMTRCSTARQFEKAWAFVRDHDCPMGQAEWGFWAGAASMSGPQNPSVRDCFTKAIELHGSAMDFNHAQALYAHMLRVDDAPMILSLLKAGVRPSDKWMVSIPVEGERRWNVTVVSCPALVAAKAMKAPACFDLLRRLKPVVRHAGEDFNLLALKTITVTDALDLDELGVRLEDSTGANVLHVWALADKESPRSGWPTLAKRKPHYLSSRFNDKSALETQLAFLSGESGQEFEKSLARVEARELIREIGPKSKKKTAPSSKSRL